MNNKAKNCLRGPKGATMEWCRNREEVEGGGGRKKGGGEKREEEHNWAEIHDGHLLS